MNITVSGYCWIKKKDTPEFRKIISVSHFWPLAILRPSSTLFFTASIRVNIIVHLTKAIQQNRGLLQGDPISPLLFSLAFDSLLKSTTNHPTYAGLSFIPSHSDTTSETDISVNLNPHVTIPESDSPLTLKPLFLCVYADDTLVILNNQDDFQTLQAAYATYSEVSNAKLNYEKTEAFALNGTSSEALKQFLVGHGIARWHSLSSTAPLRYLGFQLCFSTTQRNNYGRTITDKIQNACSISQTATTFSLWKGYRTKFLDLLHTVACYPVISYD